MEKAIALSLGQKYEEYISSGEDEDWDEPEEKKKMVPFQGQGVSMGGEVNVNYEKFFIDPEDVEMLSIMKMTVEEKFKFEPEKGIDVMFRLPSGKKEKRRFSEGDTIESVYDWVWLNRHPRERFYLVDFLSRQKIVDLNIPLNLLADPEDHTVIISITDL